ncbi:MAG: tetratricopeptide repeat protein [Cyanobacteria bacterium]|jgi:tetratricopeptide (TPR) repeat protein|nr:tetratricopeptide repeat protein [Cyanobacteria bacterium GSL.Bin1]
MGNKDQPNAMKQHKWRICLVVLAVGAVVGIWIFSRLYAIYKIQRANTFVRKGQYRSAIALYDQGLETFPKAASIWLNQGFAFAQVKRFEDQLQSYNQALTLDPELIEALNGKALALNALDLNQEALSVFEELLLQSGSVFSGLLSYNEANPQKLLILSDVSAVGEATTNRWLSAF